MHLFFIYLVIFFQMNIIAPIMTPRKKTAIKSTNRTPRMTPMGVPWVASCSLEFSSESATLLLRVESKSAKLRSPAAKHIHSFF